MTYGEFEYVRDISIFTQDFKTSYDKNSDFGYTLVVDVDYPEYLQVFYRDLPFLPEKYSDY